eukprot:TRINITY_DN3005_c0_g1_i2.p1 TRINITY_DN3005_c0_g1~~TRINITY_DN3005_c0_g1_i2.p1  ORF type:complete len:460 (+),score=75.36 TRINITY_DN3005_c0_g1_i2:62-1441(+)
MSEDINRQRSARRPRYPEEELRPSTYMRTLESSDESTELRTTLSTVSTDLPPTPLNSSISPLLLSMSPASGETADASTISASLLLSSQANFGRTPDHLLRQSPSWQRCLLNGPSNDVTAVTLNTKSKVLVKSNNVKITITFENPRKVLRSMLVLSEYEDSQSDSTQKLRRYTHNGFEFYYDIIGQRGAQDNGKIFEGKINGDTIPPPSRLYGVGRPVVGLVVFQSWGVLHSREESPTWSYCKTEPFVIVSHVDDTTQGLIGYGVTVRGLGDAEQLFQFIISTLTENRLNSPLKSQSKSKTQSQPQPQLRPQPRILPEEYQFFECLCKDTYNPDQRDLISLAQYRQFSLLSRFSNWMSKMTALLREDVIYEAWQERVIDGFIPEQLAITRLEQQIEGTYILRFDHDLDEPGSLRLSYVKEAYPKTIAHEKIVIIRSPGQATRKVAKIEFLLKSANQGSEG